jgi:hypothetical protein
MLFNWQCFSIANVKFASLIVTLFVFDEPSGTASHTGCDHIQLGITLDVITSSAVPITSHWM